VTARAALLLAAALAPPQEDAPIRVEAEASAVEFGEGFPLAVVRTWEHGEEPGPFREGALAPLVLRPLGTEVREEGGRVVETRRFVAHAFVRGSVRTAEGGFSIRVLPSVDPRDPGPPEWAEPLLPPPRFPWAWALAAAAAAAGAGWVALRRRVPARAPAPEPLREDPRAEALRRLAALRASPAPDLLEAADLLRGFLDRSGVPAPRRTTEEVLADPRTGEVLGAERLPRLAEALGGVDLVKFALAAPDAGERERLLDAAGRALGGGGPPG